jgi:hypothetical protein
MESFTDAEGIRWVFDAVHDQWRSVEGQSVKDTINDGQVSQFQGYASRARIIEKYGIQDN